MSKCVVRKVVNNKSHTYEVQFILSPQEIVALMALFHIPNSSIEVSLKKQLELAYKNCAVMEIERFNQDKDEL